MLTKLWSQLSFIIIASVLVLFPFLLVPFSPDFSEWNRAYLLFSGVIILIFSDLINLGRQKKLLLHTSPFTRGVVLLLFSFMISTFLAANKVAGVLSPLGLGIVIVLSIWYVLLSNILSIKKIKILLKISFVTGVIFSLFVILENLSVFKLINLKLYELYKLSNFTTNPYESLSFLAPILIILGYYLFGLFKNNHRLRLSREILLVVSFFILLTASLFLLPWPASVKTSAGTPSSSLTSYVLNPTSNLPLSFGWSISLDSLKQPKTAVFGYGVENFPVAFNLNRPAGLNSTFSRSSNFFLHLMTENGLLGLLAFLYLLFLVFKETKTFFLSSRATERSEGVEGSSAERVSLDSSTSGAPSGAPFGRNDNINELIFLGFWSTVLLMLLLPPNLTLLFYFFTFLALMASVPHLGGVHSATSEVKNTPKTYDLSNLENTIWIVSGTLIFLIFLIVYFAGRSYLAELNYQKALSAIARNEKVGPVYSLLKSSADLNPSLAKYHQTLSQTMLFWGTSLTKKDNLTQKDRQDGTTLIQQAIAQAQQAISLNPRDAGAWQNLGEIYRSLILAVSGADLWAQTALTQAVALNPNNPQARFSLAGLYTQISQWENAKRQLELVVALDPNFANGFYNLYYVQKQQGLYQDALNSLNQTLSLVQNDASQSAKLQTEKTALEKLIGPTPQNSALQNELSPKLQLPQSSSPPAHFKP